MLMKIKNSRSWPEGHYESGNVCDLEIFLELSHWVFFKTPHGVRRPGGVVRERTEFFTEKFPLGKNNQELSKMTQNGFFLTILKNFVFDFF